MRVVRGLSCPGGNSPRWELFGVRVVEAGSVRGGSCLVGIVRVGVFSSGSCLVGSCSDGMHIDII